MANVSRSLSQMPNICCTLVTSQEYLIFRKKSLHLHTHIHLRACMHMMSSASEKFRFPFQLNAFMYLGLIEDHGIFARQRIHLEIRLQSKLNASFFCSQARKKNQIVPISTRCSNYNNCLARNDGILNGRRIHTGFLFCSMHFFSFSFFVVVFVCSRYTLKDFYSSENLGTPTRCYFLLIVHIKTVNKRKNKKQHTYKQSTMHFSVLNNIISLTEECGAEQSKKKRIIIIMETNRNRKRDERERKRETSETQENER